MTQEIIDIMWQQAMKESIKDGAIYIRHHFAKLVAEKEREACAKVCDDKHDTWRWDDEADSASGPRDCAAAIRARG